MPGSKHIMNSICSFIVKYRLIVLSSFILLVLFFSLNIPNIKTDVILNDLFPYDHPYLKIYGKFARIFGTGATNVAIALKVKKGDIFNEKTLTKIKNMTGEVEMWDEVYRLLTISIASMGTKVATPKARGEISFASLMFPYVPKTQEQIDMLKYNVFCSPTYYGKLVSYDGTAALLITMFKEDISYEKAFEILQSLRERYSDENTSIHIIGYPMLMGWIYSYKQQMYTVFGISALIMILILYLVFRNIVGMIAPIALSIICTLLGLSFIGWYGVNFSPLTYVLAFLVGARMLSNAVQITHRYIEEYQVCGDNKIAAYETMRAMWMPNAAAVATDAAGFMVLALAKIVLMQQIAIMMSFWMATIVISGMLVPLICSFLPMKTDTMKIGVKQKTGRLAGINSAIADFSIGKYRYIIWLIVGVVLIAGTWQTSNLEVGDPTPGSSILWPNHPYNRDQKLINTMFKASADNFVLYYEGAPSSVYDTQIAKTFEKFAIYMAKKLPDIYKSSDSIIDLGKEMNFIFRDGDEIRRQLPRKEDELLKLFGTVERMAGVTTNRRYMDVPNPAARAQITLFFADHTSYNMLRVRKAAYDFFKNNSMKTDNGAFYLAGGRIGLEIALNEEMKRTHAQMDILVLLTIFIMCSLAFRSIIAGAMLIIPLILSNLVAFGYMAMTNIGLSTNTLPCSAVGVGVGIDFAIYLYSRCMEEFPSHSNYKDTVMAAVKTAGSGIVFTGITLIVPIITWYFISAMKFQAQMGFFLAMLLLINMIAALTLHPLLIMTIKPKFIQRRNSAPELLKNGIKS